MYVDNHIMYSVQCTVLYTVYVYNLCNYCILMQADFQHVFIKTNDVISYTIIRVLSFAIENNNKKINILYVSFLILVNTIMQRIRIIRKKTILSIPNPGHDSGGCNSRIYVNILKKCENITVTN